MCAFFALSLLFLEYFLFLVRTTISHVSQAPLFRSAAALISRRHYLYFSVLALAFGTKNRRKLLALALALALLALAPCLAPRTTRQRFVYLLYVCCTYVARGAL